jgi:hypothetical protein
VGISSITYKRSKFFVPVVLLLGISLWLAQGTTVARSQVAGDEAELERLRVKAEDAMANEDADGAAMAMGRAALMALHLAKRETDGLRSQMFQGAEHLFRSQEHGYRALALFRRAGGELPASSGVCGSLRLAQTEVEHSRQTLAATLSTGDRRVTQQAHELRQAAETWLTVLSSMQIDFQCG